MYKFIPCPKIHIKSFCFQDRIYGIRYFTIIIKTKTLNNKNPEKLNESIYINNTNKVIILFFLKPSQQ